MNPTLNKRILIVEDDAGLLRAMKKVLAGAGALVDATVWAGDAIEILTRKQYPMDLVITDLRMPFLTGLTLVYSIHQIFPDLPIIVLTAFGTPELKDECLRQGATAFLEKPLDTAQLLAVIGAAFAAPSSPGGAARELPPPPPRRGAAQMAILKKK